ncbi:MscL family protein [Mycoplasmopsis agassizii]|uniref:large conductance mechanosensitive channel protein MscL n=1 Tax=Mycoplasmopsis agassizii TaxID=33922 RepID=UPI00352754AA
MKNKFKKASSQSLAVIKRGNMFMLAIGLLLGTVFGALVGALANGIIMGAINEAVAASGVALSNGLRFGSIPSDGGVGAIRVDLFIGALINFVVVAFFIFLMLVGYFLIVNWRESRKPQPEPAPVVPTTEELILEELKKLNLSHRSSN